jgi:gluconokinase
MMDAIDLSDSLKIPAHPILIFMGVSGSGKTTAAELFVTQFGWDYAEGDAFHPAANIAKMSAGHPLTDEDRWPWLHEIADWIDEHISKGESAVVTCSALKKVYRDILRRPEVIFVDMDGSQPLIAERLNARLDHFMPSSLLDSQFATLEPLDADEQSIKLDLSYRLTPQEEVDAIAQVLGIGNKG